MALASVRGKSGGLKVVRLFLSFILRMWFDTTATHKLKLKAIDNRRTIDKH